MHLGGRHRRGDLAILVSLEVGVGVRVLAAGGAVVLVQSPSSEIVVVVIVFGCERSGGTVKDRKVEREGEGVGNARGEFHGV